MEDAHQQAQDTETHSTRDVRGGEIILRTRRKRAIFIGGLAAFVILTIVLVLAGLA